MGRARPDRLLPWTFETLSAEVARQCIEEWAAWRDYGEGDRYAACDRMAILVELGREQAALVIQRTTGWETPRGRSRGVRTRETAAMLVGATADNPEDLAELTISRIRNEVQRPYLRWVAQQKGTER